jgi:SAM-dependent methyltransferase
MPWKPPDVLKPVLVPIWNAGPRVTRRARELARAARHGWFGRCDVCGRFGPWLYRPEIICDRLIELSELTPPQAAALRRKETLECSWCKAKQRARRLAQVVLSRYPAGRPVSSLKEWVEQPEIQALAVAEINIIDGMHRYLTRLPKLAFSDFHDGTSPGESANGTRHEDLTRLTYPDAAFDLVLTSESLEHVPDLTAALGEILRVLKPGGHHIFTLPLFPDVAKTYARAVVRADGTEEHRAPRLCHPWGDHGWLVYTEFGADLPEILRAAGFETEVKYGPTRDDDIAQVYVCRKPK